MLSQKIFINKQICGVLTCPKDIDNSTKLPGVIFFHGFGSDKNEVNNIYEKMSIILAENNIVSLRIDFRGYGESLGKTEDSSIATMISDAECAYDYISKITFINTQAISIIGFSLGAAIAMLIIYNLNCQSLVLISPALYLTRDFTKVLGQDVMNELSKCKTYLEVDLGWRKIKVGRNFYDNLSNYHPSMGIKNYFGKVFCMAGSNDFSAANVEIIHKQSANCKKEIILDADHIFLLPNGNSVLEKIASELCSWIKINAQENVYKFSPSL